MTNREFFTAIANNEEIDSTLRSFAENAIAKLDKSNASKASKPSKTTIENRKCIPVIVEYLSTCSVPVPASIIAENCGFSSPSKTIAILNIMRKDGTVEVEKIKSTSKSGGKINGYFLKTE